MIFILPNKMASAEEYNAFEDNIVRPVKLKWSIKGYHVFHLRPHQDIPLRVEPELNNAYDHNAKKVMMPDLQDIPNNLHCTITRAADARFPVQRVHHIAGKHY